MNPHDAWLEEKRSAFLCRACAKAERGSRRAELFARLAGEAEAQAAIRRAQLTSKGGARPGPFLPDARTRVVARLVAAVGPRPLRGVLAAMKVRGMSAYDGITVRDDGHGLPRQGAVREHWPPDLGCGGRLRAAVFGVSNGLVSNAALILGVAGAGAAPRVVLTAGVAGLAAGALSMAAGAYVSVRSQRELRERQVACEREELAKSPEAEAREPALIYAAKGVPARIAHELGTDPEHALDTLARGKLGLDPAGPGSPWGAAASSCGAFALGALIPLGPFLLLRQGALPIAVAASAIALFGIGALLSLFTGRGAIVSGARMLALGGAAALVTHAVGRLAGVALG